MSLAHDQKSTIYCGMQKLRAQHETVLRLFKAYRKQGMTVSAAVSLLATTLQLSEDQVTATLQSLSEML